jgi:hypothetical protein
MQREVIETPVDVMRSTSRLSDSLRQRPDTFDEVMDEVYGQMTAMLDMDGTTVADALAFLAMSRYCMSLRDAFQATMAADAELMRQAAYQFSKLASQALERVSGHSSELLIGGTQAKALN